MDIREINIIGAGSLGSYTTQILAKMHPTWQCALNVWDFDKVEEHNVNNQLYGRGYIKKFKVDALAKIILKLGGPVPHIINKAVDGKTDLSGLVVVAVDSMSVRKTILEICQFNWGVDYLIEARMGGHMGKIFALDPRHPEAVIRYNQYLYGDENTANPICTTNETLPALWTVAASIADTMRLYRQALFLKDNFIEITVNLNDLPIVNSNTYALI